MMDQLTLKTTGSRFLRAVTECAPRTGLGHALLRDVRDALGLDAADAAEVLEDLCNRDLVTTGPTINDTWIKIIGK